MTAPPADWRSPPARPIRPCREHRPSRHRRRRSRDRHGRHRGGVAASCGSPRLIGWTAGGSAAAAGCGGADRCRVDARPCALELGELGVAAFDPELLRALVPGARLVGIGLDAMRADLVDEGLVVGRPDHQRRLAAAGLRRALEIGAGAGEIADIDHLLAMGDEIVDAAALAGAEDQRRLGVGRDVEPGEALARIVPSAATSSMWRSDAPVRASGSLSRDRRSRRA